MTLEDPRTSAGKKEGTHKHPLSRTQKEQT
jgi:hypothetical protein